MTLLSYRDLSALYCVSVKCVFDKKNRCTILFNSCMLETACFKSEGFLFSFDAQADRFALEFRFVHC